MKLLNKFLWICGLFLTFSGGSADLPSDWQHEQSLDVSTGGLIKVSLPADTLNAARPGLEDLRLYDDAGKEVPYLIECPAPSPKLIHSAKSFFVSLNANNTVIMLETGLAQPLEAVTLESPAMNYLKSVRVESSIDGIKWQTLAQGRPIFHQPDGAANMKISFSPVTARWLRLTVDDTRSAPVPFTGALIHAATGEQAPVETVPATISERNEGPGQTRLALDLGAANLDIAGLQLETTEPLFMRQIFAAVPQVSDGAIREMSVGQGQIYRVAVEGQSSSENLQVPIENTIPSRELILLIRNGDSPPLPVSSVQIERRPVYLAFLAQQPGTFHLLTGNAHCAAPNYDLAALNMNLKTVPLSLVKMGAVADNPNFHAPEVLPGLEIAGAPLDTSAWRFRKHLKISAAGAQEIELDPEILARANSAFADLRVMRGSNQVPYIIERTSINRSIAPSITATNDAKDPGVSRWIIQLPQASLPLTKLTCTVTTPLFQRDLQIYEEVTDDRGEQYQRGLGEATWTQTPDSKNQEFTLALDEVPQTSTLYLETKNGDNSPITLEQVKFFYPVTRVQFKAAPGDDLYLYYGNPDAAPPYYDLSLVANQLLAADKNTASLAGEESLGKSTWHQNEIAAKAGILFWAALSLVVIVLLLVISRLLPKPSPPPRS